MQEKKQFKDKPLKKKTNKRKQVSANLPAIPDKLYFTISEVSDLCAVKAYVLRYWEQEFPQLKPIKRKGRRYYQRHDILLVRQIKTLLYENGFTIDGARAQLANTSETGSQSLKINTMVKKVIADLESVLQNLQAETTISH
jgi:DNA-binding transcriptional MerR regulator